MADPDNLSDADKIAFGRKMIRAFKEADRRGVSPERILDEQDGHVLARSEGWPCVLAQWTILEDGENADILDHNVEGKARVGMRGLTLYATDDGMTLVRFQDGKEIWCCTKDLSID